LFYHSLIYWNQQRGSGVQKQYRTKSEFAPIFQTISDFAAYEMIDQVTKVIEWRVEVFPFLFFPQKKERKKERKWSLTK